MKIKHLTKPVLLFLLFVLASPAMATVAPKDHIVPETAESRAWHLKNRLEEIKSMDKQTMDRADKKMLRREVREIKKELAAISGGVYLSVGAIILIALLLILLL